ncbi:MAG: hypothetical protein ABC542_02750 [Candidatus Methanosuratincola petrocarbonis]
MDYSPSAQKLQRLVFNALKVLKAPKAHLAEAMKAVSDLISIERAAEQGNKEGPEGQADPLAFGKVKATPLLDVPLEPIHPAIGLTSKFAYIGALITSQAVVADEKTGETKTFVKELPYLVTSERKLIGAHPESLAPMGLRLLYDPTLLKGKWSEKGIKRYLEGHSPDPIQLYYRIRMQFVRFYEIEEEWYDFFTLWTIGTYFFHLFTSYPYIFLMGVKGSGKSKLLNLVANIAFNAAFSNNMSSSSLFRSVQGGRCTLLIDEAEDLRNPQRREDVRSLLLAGYKKGSLVYRVEKDSHERLIPVGFEIYAPKILANIGGIEDILESRCITIVTKRGLDTDKINSEIIDSDPIWQEIRDDLHAFYLDHARELEATYQRLNDEEVLKGINARDRELWKPLYVLARFFDDVVSADSAVSVDTGGVDIEKNTAFFNTPYDYPFLSILIEKLAKASVEERAQEEEAESIDHFLLRALYSLANVKEGYYPLVVVKNALLPYLDGEPEWVNNKWIGRALKRLTFKDKRRTSKGIEYHITKQRVEDIARRLKVELEADQPSQEAEKPPVFSVSDPPVHYTNSTNYTNNTPTKAESCASCQEYQMHYEICSLDGEHRDPGFVCKRFQPKPLDRRCLTCRFWAGSDITQAAYCTKQGGSALKEGSCDSWEAK